MKYKDLDLERQNTETTAPSENRMRFAGRRNLQKEFFTICAVVLAACAFIVLLLWWIDIFEFLSNYY